MPGAWAAGGAAQAQVTGEAGSWRADKERCPSPHGTTAGTRGKKVAKKIRQRHHSPQTGGEAAQRPLGVFLLGRGAAGGSGSPAIPRQPEALAASGPHEELTPRTRNLF